jgi:ferredoxin--NADP+ reductase
VQAAWTPTELHEMGELAGADVLVDPTELELDPASEAELAGATNIVQRNFEILREFAGRTPSGKPRAVRLRFRVSPVALLGAGKVEAVEVVKNRLEPDGKGSVRAGATEEREVIQAGLVFRSVGYRGVALPGTPFDESTGTMPNAEGRVLDEFAAPIPGLYAAGWIKRGPTGVIGTNKKDAVETVEHLLADARTGLLPRPDGYRGLEDVLLERGVEAVMYQGWGAIDTLERGRGAEQGRPRVKLCTWDELITAARG